MPGAFRSMLAPDPRPWGCRTCRSAPEAPGFGPCRAGRKMAAVLFPIRTLPQMPCRACFTYACLRSGGFRTTSSGGSRTTPGLARAAAGTVFSQAQI